MLNKKNILITGGTGSFGQAFTAKILKNRCFSSDKKNIRILGKLCVTVLKQNKIGSVSKHIPVCV